MVHDSVEGGRSKDLTMNMVRILAKSKVGFRMVHINAQSLNNKLDEFKLVFENSEIDVICVSETWLEASIPDGLICPCGYKVFRSDRERHGGGVAIFVRNNIFCKLCCSSASGDEQGVEFIFIEVFSHARKLLVGCVYRPNRRIPLAAFYAVVENLTSEYNDIVITGDFNSNLLAEVTLPENLLSLGLFPVNTIYPTHFTSSTSTLIDLFFVSNTDGIILYDQISAPCFSKHDLIFLNYNFQFERGGKIFNYRDFGQIDTNHLCEYSSLIPWSDIYFMPSVDEQSSFLERSVKHLFDLTVPLKRKNIKAKQKPWFSNIVRDAINQRDTAYARWKRFRTSELYLIYSMARKNVNRKIKNAKTEYYSNRFSSAIDSRRTWNTIREIGLGNATRSVDCQVDTNMLNRKFTNIPMVPTDPDYFDFSPDTPNVDNEIIDGYFSFSCVTQYDVMLTFSRVRSNAVGSDDIHPKFVRILLPLIIPYVTHLFNSIIISGVYPSNWKHAKIVPLPKANGEYRPIAILCFLSKVLEKLLYRQITTYLNTHSLLNDYQSGFRQGHSCVTALVEVSENIRQGLDNGYINFLVLLDHSKAFDTVDHDILIKKLKHFFKFSNMSTKLVSSYLTNRTQSVVVNDTWSDSLPVNRGVPQGSTLGPLLFSIYANDLPGRLSNCRVHLYADDVQITLSSPVGNIEMGVSHLNEDLEKVYLWAGANGLCLNPGKSKCILICKKRLMPFVTEDIILGGEKIEIVNSARNLGIIFNSNLTWTDHINSLVGQSYVKLRALWSTQYFTPLRIRILLAKTYLIPSLLYGCELFGNCDSVSKRKLNVLYNNIIRYVYGLKRFDHVSSAANNLYGVSFENLLKIRTLTLLHKVINTQTPNYIFDKIRFFQSTRHRNIVIPRHQSLVSEWHFHVHAARLWNNLPLSQQINSNANNFKTFLFEFFA